MKKIILLICLGVFLISNTAFTKVLGTDPIVGQTKDKLLEKYGRALLEAIKSDKPDKLLALSLIANEVISTVQLKTKNEKIRNEIIKVFKGNESVFQEEIEHEFHQIKEHLKINWQNTEYLYFRFDKNIKNSKNLNFDWGDGILYFISDNRHYKLVVGEFTPLLTGWKGGDYSLHTNLSDSAVAEEYAKYKSLEKYGKDLLESFKAAESEKMIALSYTFVEFTETIQEKTPQGDWKTKMLKDLQRADEEGFLKIKSS